jgi:hypothetical protein
VRPIAVGRHEADPMTELLRCVQVPGTVATTAVRTWPP